MNKRAKLVENEDNSVNIDNVHINKTRSQLPMSYLFVVISLVGIPFSPFKLNTILPLCFVRMLYSSGVSNAYCRIHLSLIRLSVQTYSFVVISLLLLNIYKNQVAIKLRSFIINFDKITPFQVIESTNIHGEELTKMWGEIFGRSSDKDRVLVQSKKQAPYLWKKQIRTYILTEIWQTHYEIIKKLIYRFDQLKLNQSTQFQNNIKR
eukprot:TRINITY_DN1875_c0_g1_i3.p3 TRINITY_DN1875_c0_g1~~TRINITY_DN1875_c0_g1_i3.p3  ORF type:complete len:207 (+),score=-5.61 TRINITY_DN1875_c0_g1_i3:954-1574(+)